MVIRFFLLLFVLSFHSPDAANLKRKKSKRRPKAVKQRVKSVQKKRLQLPSKNKLPSQKKNPTFDLISAKDKKSTSSVVEIDKNLKIKFPTMKKVEKARRFIYSPYTQQFIHTQVRFFHVTLAEIESDLLELDFKKNRFVKDIRLLTQTLHLYNLFTEHNVFHMRKTALEPIRHLKDKIVHSILLEVLNQPDKKLNEIKSYLLSKDAEILFALSPLFAKLVHHINPKVLKSNKSYEWFQTKAEALESPELQWTYYHYLNKNPQLIVDQFKRYLKILYHENILAYLPMSSKTYLDQARSLAERFYLLNPEHSVKREIQLHLEFYALQFEDFESFVDVYEQLIKVYPKLPGASEFFKKNPKKAQIFFHFFDQLNNYAQRNYERGKYACQVALPINTEACDSHWTEATRIYKYVAKHTPFSLFAKEAIDRLSHIEKNRAIDKQFITKSELYSYIDNVLRPLL
ncbi:MAG: hypothetical protein KC646_02855 [Candidatus Cloacimonetes bacterium]|nr:hypothetical protein [Candidatus Cloacimonadota bacterium]